MEVAALAVKDGHPISRVTTRFRVFWPTMKRWANRYALTEQLHLGFAVALDAVHSAASKDSLWVKVDRGCAFIAPDYPGQ